MPKSHKLLLYISLIVIILAIPACDMNEKEYYIHYGDYNVPASHKKNVVLSNVDSYQQSTSYTCGPSVVMTLLQHYGKLSTGDMNSATEMRIAKEMGTTETGTNMNDMVAWLKSHGFDAQIGENVSLSTVIDNINRGIPTIIEWNDFSLHSMLVVGYASDGQDPSGDSDVIFTADPASGGSVENNGVTTRGIDSITPNQLSLNQINAKAFFNPSHSATGLYIVATPK